MVREFANKSHGVREAIAIAFAHVHLARQRVERGEQAILDEHVLTGDGFEQTRLAGIGVADEGGGRQIAATLPLIGTMLGDVFEPLLEHRDLATNDAPVGFQLRFAGTSESDATANTRQVRPHAGEPRQQVLELRQLHLELRLVTARARREDVENDFGAIHHAHAEALLELDALHGREALVEEHQRRAGRGQLVLQRFDFALTEVEVRRRGIDALDGPADHFGAGGVGETLEFFQVLVDMHRVVRALAWGPNEKSTLYGRLNLN